MSDKKNVEMSGEEMVARAKDFWTRNSKPIMIACGLIIVLGGGWLVYKKMFKGPAEVKAREAIYKAEEYYRNDSINLALNGDGQSLGFLRVIKKYGGTKAGKLANYYAGSCYIKLNDNQNAVKYLKDFSTSSKPVQARAYKLLGDAYADLGQNNEALENYKKAARHFEADKLFSSEALYLAATLATKMKDNKEAIALFTELKDKYQREKGFEAEQGLGLLGVYSSQQ